MVPSFINPELPPTMKTKLPLIAALTCGLSSIGSAFTLDFIGDEGTMLPTDPLVVFVSGYGNVQFDAVGPSTLIVDNRFENDGPGQTTSPSLNFDSGDQVKVTFLAAQPINVEFDWVGTNAGEFFTAAPGATSKEFLVTLNGAAFEPVNNGAGLYQIGFEQVPEPSAALLGALGTALLVLRRRR